MFGDNRIAFIFAFTFSTAALAAPSCSYLLVPSLSAQDIRRLAEDAQKSQEPALHIPLAEIAKTGIWDYETILNHYGQQLSKKLHAVAGNLSGYFFARQKKIFLTWLFENVLHAHHLDPDFLKKKRNGPDLYEIYRRAVLSDLSEKAFDNVLDFRAAALLQAKNLLPAKLQKKLGNALLPGHLRAAGLGRNDFEGRLPIEIVVPSGALVRVTLGLDVDAFVENNGALSVRGPATDVYFPRQPALTIQVEPALLNTSLLPAREELAAIAKIASDAAKPLGKK